MAGKPETIEVPLDLLWAISHRLRGGDALDDGTTVTSCRWCGKRWSKRETHAKGCRMKQLGDLLESLPK